MKTTNQSPFRRRLLTSAAMGMAVLSVCATATAGAAAPAQAMPQAKVADGYRPMQKAANNSLRVALPQRKTLGKTDAQAAAYDVTFSVPGDKNVYVPSAILFYNAENGLNGYVDYNEETGAWEGMANVPAGTYDILTMIDHKDANNNNDRSLYVVKENVVIGPNTPALVFDPAEATNHISFATVLPDGSPLTYSTCTFDADWNYTPLTQGNVTSVQFINTINHSDFGTINYAISSAGSGKTLPSETNPYAFDPEAANEIYVNNVSDKYEFRQVRLMVPSDASKGYAAATVFSQRGGKTVQLSNNASAYYSIPMSFKDSPLAAQSEENDESKYILYVGSMLGTEEIPAYHAGTQSNSPSIHTVMYCPTVNGDTPMLDLQWEYMDTYIGRAYKTSTGYMFPLSRDDNRWSYFPTNDFRYGAGGTYGQWFPGHPGFASDIKDVTPAIGETAPFYVATLSKTFESYYKAWIPSFNITSYGQLGELRQADLKAHTFSLKMNGEEVLTDYNNFWSWVYSLPETEGYQPGAYELKMENPNYTLDGVAGKVTYEAKFDQSKEDGLPPAIQMLQMRTVKDDKVGYEFETPADGKLYFCGSDLVFNTGTLPDGRTQNWFDFGTTETRVEYAPAGTGRFYPLEITARPDLTYWGFAEMSEVSFAGVTNGSANNLYDLRITMTDPSGNSMTQTIAPAFKIKSGVGVDDMAADIDGTVDVYSIDGTLMMRGADAIALTGLSKGIYILRSGNKAVKRVIR